MAKDPGKEGNSSNQQIIDNAKPSLQAPVGTYRIAGKQVTREAYFAWVNGKNAGK